MILIDPAKCNGCGVCPPYCTVGAISLVSAESQQEPAPGTSPAPARWSEVARVDPKTCTDCYVCVRHKVCGRGAMTPGPLPTFYDVFRHVLSDPTETTAETGVPGRGTEESKTNDVTGRVLRGEIGLAVDMGRPGVGVRLADVEKATRALVAAGLKLEPPEDSPLGKVLGDLTTGEMSPEARDRYLLSVIIEGKAPASKLGDLLAALKAVEGQVDTVFSVGVITRVDATGWSPVPDEVERLGLPRPFRGKVNVGLGRPLVDK